MAETGSIAAPLAEEPVLGHSDSKHQDAWEQGENRPSDQDGAAAEMEDPARKASAPQLEHSESKFQDAWEGEKRPSDQDGAAAEMEDAARKAPVPQLEHSE
ncbi:hypothetical protein CYMTET_21565, partial [Cymbomonas tetramitiformis]